MPMHAGTLIRKVASQIIAKGLEGFEVRPEKDKFSAIKKILGLEMDDHKFDTDINDLIKASSVKKDTSYNEETKVNGIEISVGWDRGYNDFTIYFPQIETGKDPRVVDQVIRISENSEDAKKIFAYAKQEASKVKDVYELYKKVEQEVRKIRA